MKLSNKQKIILILVIGLIALVAFFYFIIFPFLDKIRAASNEYLTNQETLIQISKARASFGDLKKDYEKSQADILKIDGIFLNEKDIVDFVATLERIALQTDNLFEIQIIRSPAAKDLPDDKENIPFLNFRISLQGSFNGLLDFVAHLEDSPYPPYRLIGLDDLNIKKASEGGSKINVLGSASAKEILESNLTIKIYIQ